MFSSSSSKHDIFLMYPLAVPRTVSIYLRIILQYISHILENYGHARSQGGRHPVAAKPPLCTWYVFFLAEAILLLVHTYNIAVGNTPYGKRHTSRTVSVACASAVYFRRKLTRQFFGNTRTDRSIRRIQLAKLLRDERYKYHSASSKNVQVFAPPMLFYVELGRQHQAITLRPVPTSNGP